jgi:hypothetical protein
MVVYYRHMPAEREPHDQSQSDPQDREGARPVSPSLIAPSPTLNRTYEARSQTQQRAVDAHPLFQQALELRRDNPHRNSDGRGEHIHSDATTASHDQGTNISQPS